MHGREGRPSRPSRFLARGRAQGFPALIGTAGGDASGRHRQDAAEAIRERSGRERSDHRDQRRERERLADANGGLDLRIGRAACAGHLDADQLDEEPQCTEPRAPDQHDGKGCERGGERASRRGAGLPGGSGGGVS